MDLNKKYTKLTGNIMRINYITKPIKGKRYVKSVEAQFPKDTQDTRTVRVKNGFLVIECFDSHSDKKSKKIKVKIPKLFQWVKSIEWFQRHLVYTDDHPCSYESFNIDGDQLEKIHGRSHEYWKEIAGKLN